MKDFDLDGDRHLDLEELGEDYERLADITHPRGYLADTKEEL